MGSGSLLGVTQPGHGAYHPLPARTRQEIGWSYTSACPLCLPRHVMGWPI